MVLARAAERSSVLHHGGLPRQSDGRFKINDVVYLAQFEFPGLFTDLPCRPVVVSLSILDGCSFGDSVEREETPGDLKSCKQLVTALRDELKQVRIATQNAEVERKREVRSRLDHDK